MTMPSPISQLFEPIEETIVCRNHLRLWAAKNAYTLTFISALSIITWIVIVITGLLTR